MAVPDTFIGDIKASMNLPPNLSMLQWLSKRPPIRLCVELFARATARPCIRLDALPCFRRPSSHPLAVQGSGALEAAAPPMASTGGPPIGLLHYFGDHFFPK